MKLKSVEMDSVQGLSAPEGAVIADRFKLDANADKPKGAGIGAILALIAALIALAAVGATATLMYLNLDAVATA